jgi:L-seryl-tRNA(Ser) seleniumtransferase
MEHEPTVQESLSAGADVVCFSGDKLLGGPQAGMIVGKEEYLAKIRKHPLTRALRADKLCLAALSATLQHFLKNEAEQKIPVWQMIAKSPRQIKVVAESWKRQLGAGQVVKSESTVGGGSLPGETLPSYVLALTVKNPEQFNAHLRARNPAVIARTEKDLILLDPRTVLADQENTLLSILKSLLLESA